MCTNERVCGVIGTITAKHLINLTLTPMLCVVKSPEWAEDKR